MNECRCPADVLSPQFRCQASMEEIRQAAARICRDYLNGRWKEVPADQLIVKRMSGGLSNFLYYVSLPQDSSATGSEATTSSSSLHDNDENKNDLTAGDCNGNKRKRYDSSSSTALRFQEPNEVLLRIYGLSHGEDALEAMITESVVFALLSERNFGPRLHGIFPGGRIEQFIPARALLTAELAIPEISVKIAEKMGEIHTLNIPMSKEPDWIWNCMERWQRHLPDILSRTDWQNNEKYAEFVRGIDYSKEVIWMKEVIKRNNCPVMFCHNDMQEGNILLKVQDPVECSAEDSALGNMSMQEDDEDDVEDLQGKINKTTDLDSSTDSAISSGANEASTAAPDLRIIDFEYCAYNYRGFDLANHFLEWTFNYSAPEFPFYTFRREDFPTKEQRYRFIRTYLQRLNEGNEEWKPNQKEVEEIDQEVRVFQMFSHLFWSLWSVINVTSNIEFGYWVYAVTRFKEYLELKQNYITDKNMMTV